VTGCQRTWNLAGLREKRPGAHRPPAPSSGSLRLGHFVCCLGSHRTLDDLVGILGPPDVASTLKYENSPNGTRILKIALIYSCFPW